jgi:nitrite reductase (NADH) small subunit
VAWVRACGLDDLREGKGFALTVCGAHLALFLSEGEVHALEDRCPHRGAPLSSGVIHDRCYVACLEHGWSICLLDGQAQPPERGQAQAYRVQVVDGEVWVDIAV